MSLSDCLACSGCVTSAETVLIQEQSYSKLIAKLNAQDATVVVAISPQSYTSFAMRYGSSPSDAFLKLATFLKSLGVKYVFDTSAAGNSYFLVPFINYFEFHRR